MLEVDDESRYLDRTKTIDGGKRTHYVECIFFDALV